ncbi:MAG: hypothetical protein JNJ54_36655 [Myxococcaceae bacterium]|nr:hypothetical protein [Myxococcaceae bacterium]
MRIKHQPTLRTLDPRPSRQPVHRQPERPQVRRESSFEVPLTRPRARTDGTTFLDAAIVRAPRQPVAQALAPAPKAAKKSFFGRLLGGVGHVFGALVGAIKNKVLGPPYPTTAAGRAQDAARIEGKFGPALARLPAAQREVLATLRRLGMDTTDLFRGSHAVISDGGRNFEAWRQLGAVPRKSSHYPDVPGQQYELQLKDVGVLLFGRTAKGDTWCQMEAHSGAGINLGHLFDYVKHKLSGNLNVGPAGTSPHSEKRGQELHLRG